MIRINFDGVIMRAAISRSTRNWAYKVLLLRLSRLVNVPGLFFLMKGPQIQTNRTALRTAKTLKLTSMPPAGTNHAWTSGNAATR